MTDCADYELLLALRADAGLATRDADALEAHLEGCEACRAVAKTLPPARVNATGRDHGDLHEVPEGAYLLGDEVARGGMGRIRAARDLRIGRAVVVKELLGDGPGLAARFEREARMTARLQHPGIVPIYEIGRWSDGKPFYSMRRVAGQTLRERISATRSLAERLSLLPRVLAAAEAVAYAHASRIIHRDLTPSNILVGDHGETVVIDWGLAKRLADDEEQLGPSTWDAAQSPGLPLDALTVAGSVLGTPSYMAPEQARGEPVDERADVYALGATLHHVLAGGPPGAVALPPLPPDLNTILAKALAAAPARRYADAGEMASDLRRFQAGQLVLAHHYGIGALLLRWLRRHRTLVAVAALLSAALLALGIYSLRSAIASRRRDADRVRDLTLLQARAALTSDATRAVGWLKTLKGVPGYGPETILGIAARSHGLARAVWRAHLNKIHALAVSRDGSHLATAGRDRTAKLLDRASGRWTELTGDTDEVLDITFADSGDRVATASADGTARVWDLSGRELWRVNIWDITDHTLLPQLEDAIERVVLVDDGRSLVTADRKGRICRSVQGGRPVRLSDQGASIQTLLVAPDGRLVASRGDDGSVLLTTLDPPGVVLLRLPGEPATGLTWLSSDRVATAHGRRIVVWSATGAIVDQIVLDATVVSLAAHDDRVLAGDASGAVDRWRPGQKPDRLVGPAAQIGSLAAIDAQAVLAGAEDGSVRVYDFASGVVWVLRGHDGPATQVKVVNDGFISAGVDGTVRLWPRTPPVDLVRGVAAPVVAVDFDADGPVVLGHDDGTVELVPGGKILALGKPLFDVATSSAARRVAVTSDHAMTIVGWDGATVGAAPLDSNLAFLAWSRDGARVAASSATDRVSVFDADGRLVHVLHAEGNVEARLAFTSGGELVTAGWDGTVRLWNVDAEVSRILGRHQGAALGVAASTDGRLVASVGADGVIQLYEPAAGTARIVGRQDGALGRVLFSKDGRLLLTGGRDLAIGVWDLAGGGGRLLRGHTDGVALLTITADNRHVASAGQDGTVRIWDLASGQSVALANCAGGPIAAIWMDGGARLLTTGADGTVRVLDMTGPREPAGVGAWLNALTTYTLE